MDKLMNIVDKFLGQIYNGNLIRQPMVVVYYLMAVVCWALPIGAIYLLCDKALPWDYMSSAAKVFAILFCILIVAALIAGTFVATRMWIDRKNDLNKIINNSNDNYALVLTSHFMRTLGESAGILLYTLIVPGVLLRFAVFFSDSYGDTFGLALWQSLLIIVGFFVAAWVVMLITRASAEWIMNIAKIGNNVSDIADITREKAGL